MDRQPRLLITGDYWHVDFKRLISDCPVATTLMTMEQLSRGTAFAIADFDLIVIAQSRPSQFPQERIDSILRKAHGTPVVAAMGSWCEGEQRSGTPLQGVKRVFWHQFEGQFEQFLAALSEDRYSSWTQPVTLTNADKIQSTVLPSRAGQAKRAIHSGKSLTVGVSAWNRDTWLTLSDAVRCFGWQPVWVERMASSMPTHQLDVILVDADSMTKDLMGRLMWIRRNVSRSPVVLLLNFPRHQDRDQYVDLGVREFVHKPFELTNLHAAMSRRVDNAGALPRPMPSPKMLGGSVRESVK